MNLNEARVNRLTAYVQGVLDRRDGKTLYLEYRKDIESVVPQEIFEILYRVWSGGVSHEAILNVLDKLINVFYHALSRYTWPDPQTGSFLEIMMRENDAMNAKMDEIKALLKLGQPLKHRQRLQDALTPLLAIDAHYQKKENLLFPMMEQRQARFHGVAIMWALHDKTRQSLKKVLSCLEDESTTESELHGEIGQLFFNMIGLAQKENLILYPCAAETLEAADFNALLAQSFEYGFPFLDPDTLPRPPFQSLGHLRQGQFTADGLNINTGTGILNADQFIMVLNALPVDLTYVDEYDKVRYFSRPKDRFFPRSTAIIGRDVRNCHPPQSVDTVLEIIQAFREGRQDKASFWIDLNDRKVLIQYFALFAPNPESDGKLIYRGVLEVSQDITEIQKLNGERRLLTWEG